jgi:uridine kinase
MIDDTIDVSFQRAGETMEQALSEVCKDVRIGKILIQNNDDTGEPEVKLQLNFINIYFHHCH